MKLTIVLPAYNEERVLAQNVRTLIFELGKIGLLSNAQVVIADNASVDETSKIGKWLAHEIPQVHYFFHPKKGKGGAIKAAWEKYDADIVMFMDVDLSTDLKSLSTLVREIENGADIAYGSRWHKDSKVNRSWQRHCFSFGYRGILGLLFGFIEDANCGFKAVSRRVQEELLPKIENEKFFFDSELVLKACNQNYKLKSVPILWVESRDLARKSTVGVLNTVREYLREAVKLRFKI